MIIVVKIIETNLNMSSTGVIKDHQSRIVEANSWNEYTEAFKGYDGKAVEFRSLTSMAGNTLPREEHLYNLEYNEFHLSCILSNGMFGIKKLAYLIQ